MAARVSDDSHAWERDPVRVESMVDVNRARAIRDIELLIEAAGIAGDLERLRAIELQAAASGLLSSLNGGYQNTLILARSDSPRPSAATTTEKNIRHYVDEHEKREKKAPAGRAGVVDELRRILASKDATESQKDGARRALELFGEKIDPKAITEGQRPMAIAADSLEDVRTFPAAVELAATIKSKLAQARELSALIRNPVFEVTQRKVFQQDLDALMEEIKVLQKKLEKAAGIESAEDRRIEADSKNPRNPPVTWGNAPKDNPFGEKALSPHQLRALAKADQQFGGIGAADPAVTFSRGVHSMDAVPTPAQARAHAEQLRKAGVL
jgi:hypothetical protein